MHKQLLEVADFKVTEISEWRSQQQDLAQLLMSDGPTVAVFQKLATESPAVRLGMQTWLAEFCRRLHFANATLVDLEGRPMLSIGQIFGSNDHLKEVAAEVIRKNDVVFRDFHLDDSIGTIHLSVNLPLRLSPGSPPFGALLLGIDPGDRLYPMIRRWPVPSRSAEAFLMRREGDDLVFLSNLRNRDNAALRLRLPLTLRSLPAAQAARGARGSVEGQDYRGVPVFAAVSDIPNSPWILVAKMDAEEVDAPVQRRLFLLIATTVSMILMAGAGIFAIWRRQQLQFYRARYDLDSEREALVGHYDYLTRYSNDIMLMLDESGHILEANDRAVATYGFSQEKLRTMTVRDLRHASDIDSFLGQWNQVADSGSLVFECVHQTRDGQPIHVEVSARCIRVGHRHFRQNIIRDVTERNAMDERLRHTLDVVSAVIDSSPAAIVSVTPDMKVATWNKTAEHLFGWTFDEAVGQIPPFIPADSRQDSIDNHARVSRGEVLSGMRNPAVCKDGRIVMVEISAGPLHDPEGHCSGIALNLLDVTEQTRAEEALRRSELLYRATFDHAAVGMNYCSLEGKYLRVNPKFCEITGYSAGELLQLGSQDITFPADRSSTQEIMDRLRAGEMVSVAQDKRYLCKNGSMVWGRLSISLLRDEAGDPLQFVAIVEDITERIQAEEALRHSEERFRNLVESAPEGIMVERDLRILYVNSSAVTMFGATSAAQLEGRGVLELVSEQDRDDVSARSAMVANRHRVPSRESCYLRVDGQPLPVEVSATPVAYGRKPASLVFLRDIGERKRTELETRRLQDQLLQSQKMESLGRLAGGVAHDFNNHLTVILGYCDMLLGRLNDDVEGSQELEEIRAASERAGGLTLQLLAFSRKQIAERKPVNLNEIVAADGKMLSRLIGEQIKVSTHLDPSLGLVEADRGQVSQILMNLSINARDAMPDGGVIKIETSNVNLPADAPLPDERAAPGWYVLLAVSDTGSGMSAETVLHVFEPFFTTKGIGIGTGLGLSTVFGIVQQSGGWIRVDSQPGLGSKFSIYLPRLPETAVSVDCATVTVEIPGGTETILLAEDQPEVRRLTVRILKGNGYRILEASNGEEALALSSGHQGPIDLLLTDVVMPGMTGRELAANLARSRPETKVLYFSGYTADVIGREGILEPGVAYLRKPFTPAQMSLKVREVLGQSTEKRKILVMDDDDAVRLMLQQTIREAGYEVLSARDGLEGMRLVSEHQFHLVLTDLVMPEQEGIETIRQLHKKYPEIRIVAMSGAMHGTYLETAGLLGAHATLRKPIDLQELLRVIRRLLD